MRVLFAAFRDSLDTLAQHRLKSLLSAFGVTVGIAAVVLLVSVVTGWQDSFRDLLEDSGHRLITVYTRDPSTCRAEGRRPVSLLPEDAFLLLHGMTATLEDASPETLQPGVTVRYSGQTGSIPLRGVYPATSTMRRFVVASGRFISEYDESEARRTVVVGAHALDSLRMGPLKVGETLVLGDWPFEVVGLLASTRPVRGASASLDDKAVFIPYSTLATAFAGTREANWLLVKLRRPEDDEYAIDTLKRRLSRRDGLSSDRGACVEVVSEIQQARRMTRLLAGVEVAVWLIGGVGLFIGVTGVVNVMLLGVTERTHEIGVRRAVGARRSDIRREFVLQALVLTQIGGVAGIVLGALLVFALGFIIPTGPLPSPRLAPLSVVLAFLVTSAMGLAAGVWPARRAAAVSPSEALRNE